MAFQMGTDSGMTFELYSIGDALFMKRTLDSVAALSNDGVMIGLGALGMLLGLLLSGTKAVISGGYKQDLPYLLIGFILFAVMFGMRATVTIEDVVGGPGQPPGTVYVVDNVPFGVAAMGGIISGLGLTIAEKMEQGFSLPDATSDSIVHGGLGRSLEWIDAMRAWSLPMLDSSDGALALWKRNLATYLGNCTGDDVETKKKTWAAILNSDNPFTSGGGGILSTNQFVTTEVATGPGAYVSMDCKSAGDVIQTTAADPNFLAKMANAMAPRVGAKVGGAMASPAQNLQDAFNQIGIDQSLAQKYSMGLAIGAVLDEAARRGNLSALDTNTQLMLSQAQMQRAVQWGGQETQFRRIMRPMTAFFESMVYACAPFMALVLGFGAWGFKMVGKYMILTIWVLLWLPVMSIVNLFQLTQVQHATEFMKQVDAAGGLFSFGSATGSVYFAQQIIDWIATGALLASSVPAITLMLIFGGAMTATSLAGRLQAGDHINEKISSPDAVQPAAAQQMQSALTWNQASRGMPTGSEGQQPHFTTGNTSSATESAMRAQIQRQSQRVTDAITKGVSEAWTAGRGAQVAAAINNSRSASLTSAAGARIAQESGFSTGSENAWKYALVGMVAASGGASAAKNAKGLAAQLGVDLRSSGVSEDSAVQKLGESFKHTVGTDESKTAAIAQSFTDGLTTTQTATGSHVLSASTARNLQQSTDDLRQAVAQHQDVSQRAKQMGDGQRLDAKQAAVQAVSSGQVDSFIRQGLEAGAGKAYRYQLGLLNAQAKQPGNWASTTTAQERSYVAMMQALNGDSPVPMRGEQAIAQAQALNRGFILGGASTTGGGAAALAGAHSGDNKSVADGASTAANAVRSTFNGASPASSAAARQTDALLDGTGTKKASGEVAAPNGSGMGAKDAQTTAAALQGNANAGPNTAVFNTPMGQGIQAGAEAADKEQHAKYSEHAGVKGAAADSQRKPGETLGAALSSAGREVRNGGASEASILEYAASQVGVTNRFQAFQAAMGSFQTGGKDGPVFFAGKMADAVTNPARVQQLNNMSDYAQANMQANEHLPRDYATVKANLQVLRNQGAITPDKAIEAQQAFERLPANQQYAVKRWMDGYNTQQLENGFRQRPDFMNWKGSELN